VSAGATLAWKQPGALQATMSSLLVNDRMHAIDRIAFYYHAGAKKKSAASDDDRTMLD
jgi:hypothetical protein